MITNRSAIQAIKKVMLDGHRLFKDDFREFVDTLVVALRAIEKANSPIKHIHPVLLSEGNLTFLEGASLAPTETTP